MLLEAFLVSLKEHFALYNEVSRNPYQLSGRLVSETEKDRFKATVSPLLRQLGLLRPYLEELHRTWVLSVYGKAWNVLDHAVQIGDGAIKGPSLRATIDNVEVVLGKLEAYSDDQTIQIGKPLETIEPGIGLAEQICSRVEDAAKPYLKQRSGKPKFEIKDEYDVQTLLHSLFRAYFKYVVQENPISKKAAARSTRADFSIEKMGLIVEAKYVRDPGDQKVIEKALAEDIIFYAEWPHLKHLFFVIYNSKDLDARDLLDNFSGPHTIKGKSFAVRAINV